MVGTRHITLQAGLLIASALLALAPIQWLIQSWSDPSYQSDGALIFALMVGLMVWSYRSGKAETRTPEALLLVFLLAAGVRLAGQLLAINILGALALAIDVFAIALWLRLDRRPSPLSPFWLAVLFLFALPLAPILERVLGFPLQMVSATLACEMLSPFFGDLVCEGIRLRINEVDVLVDLPCSGATGLLLLLGLWALLNALYRPGLVDALKGGVLIIVIAVMGNAVRISLLAAGLAEGVDMMAPLPHLAIGLISLGGSVLAALIAYHPRRAEPREAPKLALTLPRATHLPIALLAISLSAAIVQAPKRPLDSSPPVPEAALPQQLMGFHAAELPLNPLEAAYFATYGGTATKAQYGPMGLNVVRTGSPLRHLHSPETCLLGLGYEVQFLGTTYDPVPTSIYRATSPDGQTWHVAVSFVSANGQQTASVGEAVWSWLSGETKRWHAIQRITPATLASHDRAALEQAALSALDL